MNDRTLVQKLMRAVWLGIAETIAWLPIPLTLAVWLLPEPAWYIWIGLLPLLFTAGERLTARFSRLRRIYGLLFAACLGAGLSLLLFEPWLDVIMGAVIGILFVLRGMSAAAPEDGNQVRELLLPALLIYFIVSIAAGFIDRFDGYRMLLTAGGVFTLLLTIRRANRITLIEANLGGSGRGIPRSVVRRNRLLIGLFTVVCAIVVLFRKLEALWRELVGWLNGILSGLGSGGNPVPDEAEPALPSQPGMMPPAEGETGWFWIIMDYIAFIIGIVIAAGLVYLIFRALLRIPLLAGMIAKWFAAWRERRPAAPAGGYEDEVESLSGPAPLSNMLKRLRSLVSRGESWGAMPPEQQIRYLFRRRFKEAAKRGFAYRTGLTPSENMDALHEAEGGSRDGDGQLTEVYAAVRYGGKSAGKEEAASLKSKLDL